MNVELGGMSKAVAHFKVHVTAFNGKDCGKPVTLNCNKYPSP
jgi:hypothetical protein